MKLISGAKYAALETKLQRTVRELEDAEKLSAERRATITQQATEISRLRNEQPDPIVAAPQPAQGDAELRRDNHLLRRALADMQERLDGLQTSHVADTRELHDLRQGATS
ncbi:hypothetical protein [Streptomyces sp. NPDC091215]|uniref:hypothetical protein n=1 Tax=Streptomyces sp. NPDC091215 TaxID=3155192 RepID=UPI0034371B54